MSEQEKKRQRIYECLTPKPSLPPTKKRKKKKKESTLMNWKFAKKKLWGQQLNKI